MDLLQTIDTKGYSKPERWCGPGAIATLTGLPLVRATEMLSRITGTPYEMLSGVWNEEVILALHELGYRAEAIDIVSRFPDLTHGPTLKRFMASRTMDEKCSLLLIEVQGHYISASFGWLNDNWTLKPKPLEMFPKPGRLVKRAWKIRSTDNF